MQEITDGKCILGIFPPTPEQQGVGWLELWFCTVELKGIRKEKKKKKEEKTLKRYLTYRSKECIEAWHQCRQHAFCTAGLRKRAMEAAHRAQQHSPCRCAALPALCAAVAALCSQSSACSTVCPACSPPPWCTVCRVHTWLTSRGVTSC